MTNTPSPSRILSALAVSAGFLALGTFAPVAALAGTTANLTVSASVAANCSIGTATLPFGAYDPVGVNNNVSAAVTNSTTMSVTCTKGASGVTVALGSSANAPTGCTAPQRCLASSGSYLNYQLYSDSGLSSVWTSGVSETVAGGITTPTAVSIYGKIPGGQDASVGASYSDTVVATVNF